MIKNNILYFINKIVVIILNMIILIYSAKKIKANHPPINSTLNPETNSDSPSAKSKGLRFTSAKHLINQMYNNNRFPHIKFKIDCEFDIFENMNEEDNIHKNKIIKKNDTSYEIIWAILRIEPKWLYFEFDDHPIINIE